MPPSTPVWRILGLSVGVSYSLLGSFYIVDPARATELFGLGPRAKVSLEDKSPTATLEHVQDHRSTMSVAMLLIGARDLGIGLAICSFWYIDDIRGVAVTILAGMVVCAADVIAIWKTKGPRDGFFLGLGAATWGVIGGKLLMDCLD